MRSDSEALQYSGSRTDLIQLHSLGRLPLGRRNPSTASTMPTTATMIPSTSHFVSPLMKLPGIRFRPCPIQTAPTATAISPTVMSVVRAMPLFIVATLRRMNLGPARATLSGVVAPVGAFVQAGFDALRQSVTSAGSVAL